MTKERLEFIRKDVMDGCTPSDYFWEVFDAAKSLVENRDSVIRRCIDFMSNDHICLRHSEEVKLESFDAFTEKEKYRGCVRCLQERLNKADEVISLLDEFIGQSQGITGYHLNGDIELWEDTGLCELVDAFQRLDPNYWGQPQKEVPE